MSKVSKVFLVKPKCHDNNSWYTYLRVDFLPLVHALNNQDIFINVSSGSSKPCIRLARLLVNFIWVCLRLVLI